MELLRMKHYILTLAPVVGIAALATATSFERPDEYLLELGKELGALGVRGTIMLDLLAANGSETRRFFEVPFDGERFTLPKFTRIPKPSDELRFAAARVYRENPADIDMALVPQRLRDEVMVGACPASLRSLARDMACSEGCMRALARA